MSIELKEVVCGYGDKVILSHVNLVFQAGRFYCILGSNGIGKTTLFRTLLKFIPLLGGKIEIDGHDFQTLDTKALADFLSYVPQAKNYTYQTSVLDTVVMGQARFISKFQSPSQENYDIAYDMLEKLGIARFARNMYSELSGGEQQLVLIARALSQCAKFIIMDEPASNLDYENQKIVLDALSGLTEKGIGVIMSSHSPDHASYVNSDIVMVKRDKSVIQGIPQELLTAENLKAVYGVDIQILHGPGTDGKELVTYCLT